MFKCAIINIHGNKKHLKQKTEGEKGDKGTLRTTSQVGRSAGRSSGSFLTVDSLTMSSC